MGVGNALLDMYNEVQREMQRGDAADSVVKKVAVKPKADKKVTAESIFCPQCGEPLAFEGGCTTCKNCGWSKCN